MKYEELQSGIADVKDKALNILLVGNNPIELSQVYEALKDVSGKISSIDTAFSEKDTIRKINSSQPDCLVLDDNIGLSSLKLLIDKVEKLGKEAISITLLKSHNGQKLIAGVQEYLMKESLTGERLYKALRNIIRFRKTQQFLKMKYYSSTHQLKGLFI